MMQVCASTKREREMQNESNEIAFPDFEEIDRGDIPADLEFCISIILLGKHDQNVKMFSYLAPVGSVRFSLQLSMSLAQPML